MEYLYSLTYHSEVSFWMYEISGLTCHWMKGNDKAKAILGLTLFGDAMSSHNILGNFRCSFKQPLPLRGP